MNCFNHCVSNKRYAYRILSYIWCTHHTCDVILYGESLPLIKLSPGTRIFYLAWVIKFNVIYFWFRYKIMEEEAPQNIYYCVKETPYAGKRMSVYIQFYAF